jgi:hypothetical protein
MCNKCDQDLPDSAFYSGLGSRCKECHKSRIRFLRANNPEWQERDRIRNSVRDKTTEIKSRKMGYKDRRPLAYRAHTLLNTAVKAGKIFRGSCLFCGSDKVHGHHRDYSKPLEVIWLCAKCHFRLHAYFPETSAHEEQ